MRMLSVIFVALTIIACGQDGTLVQENIEQVVDAPPLEDVARDAVGDGGRSDVEEGSTSCSSNLVVGSGGSAQDCTSTKQVCVASTNMAACVDPCVVASLSRTNLGCHFTAVDLPNFRGPLENFGEAPFVLRVANPGPFDATITLRVPDSEQGFTRPQEIRLAAGDQHRFILDPAEIDLDLDGQGFNSQISPRGFLLESDVPIEVVQRNAFLPQLPASDDSATLFPLDTAPRCASDRDCPIDLSCDPTLEACVAGLCEDEGCPDNRFACYPSADAPRCVLIANAPRSCTLDSDCEAGTCASISGMPDGTAGICAGDEAAYMFDYRALGWAPTLDEGSLGGTNLVVASARHTLVEIEPVTAVTATLSERLLPGAAAVEAIPAGARRTFYLGPGQVLNLEASSALDSDFSGSLVRSTQPVAVFTSVRAANVPNLIPSCANGSRPVNGLCCASGDPNIFGLCEDGSQPTEAVTNQRDVPCCADHMEEQLPPVSMWGRRFDTGSTGTPSPEAPTSTLYRVQAHTFTRVTTSLPPPNDSFLLAAGAFRELDNDVIGGMPFWIEADAPVLVGAYQKSGRAETPAIPDGEREALPVLGDPAFVLVPPRSARRKQFNFTTPAGYKKHQLILTHAEPISRIVLDGASLALEEACQPSFLPGEAVASWVCDLSPGAHRLRSLTDVSAWLCSHDTHVSSCELAGWGPELSYQDQDLDDDGLAGWVDPCPLFPVNDDTDKDGIGDGCDWDLDGDGCSNEIEAAHADADPWDPDRRPSLFYVSTELSDRPAGTEEAPFRSVGAAFAEACDGVTIAVSRSVDQNDEGSAVIDAAVTITRSEPNEPITLDLNGIWAFETSGEVSLEAVGLRASGIGGLYAHGPASFTLRDMAITGPVDDAFRTSRAFSWAVYALETSVTLESVDIRAFYSGLTVVDGELSVANATFRDLGSVSAFGDPTRPNNLARAIEVRSARGPIDMEDVEISNNQCRFCLSINRPTLNNDVNRLSDSDISPVRLRSVHLFDNVGYGSALAITEAADLDIEGLRIIKHRSFSDYGGALIATSRFNNRTPGETTPTASFRLRDVEIRGNHATGRNAGLYLDVGLSSELTLTNALITANTGREVPGLQLDGLPNSALLSNLTVTDNVGLLLQSQPALPSSTLRCVSDVEPYMQVRNSIFFDTDPVEDRCDFLDTPSVITSNACIVNGCPPGFRCDLRMNSCAELPRPCPLGPGDACSCADGVCDTTSCSTPERQDACVSTNGNLTATCSCSCVADSDCGPDLICTPEGHCATPESLPVNPCDGVVCGEGLVCNPWSETCVDAPVLPVFATGPWGPHYLSQIAAGQTEDSPLVDAGDADYALLGYTTRTDHVVDAEGDDIGYHHPTSLPPAEDTDGDGIAILIDNCPEDYNPHQIDCDRNGVGDACEAPLPDTDGDRIPDPCDNCWEVRNTEQISDGCVEMPFLEDPRCGLPCQDPGSEPEP